MASIGDIVEQYAHRPNKKNKVTLLKYVAQSVSDAIDKISTSTMDNPRSRKGRCKEGCKPCVRNRFNIVAWEVVLWEEDSEFKGIKVIIQGLDHKRTGLRVSADRFSIKRPPFVVHFEEVLRSRMSISKPYKIKVELDSDLYTPPPSI